MPPRKHINERRLDQIRHEEDDVATHAELMAAGVPQSTICHRIRPGGPWQSVLPGVVVMHSGPPTRRQRVRAALKYAGPGAVVTGLTGLRARGVRDLPEDDRVHVLVPQHRQRTSTGFVIVERTARLPQTTEVGGLPCAPVARALVDACRRCERLDDVRDLAATTVQQGRCGVRQLVEECMRAQRRGQSRFKAVLAEVGAGIRSLAEARARQVLLDSDLPQPEWNASLYTRDGRLVGIPDAYWRALGLALEIDSTAWHLRPRDHRRTVRRGIAYGRVGIRTLPYSPVDLIEDPAAFVAAVRDALAAAEGSPVPDLVVVPASGQAA